jgi:hypothetical protein
MNNELDRIWKEAIMFKSKYNSVDYMDELKKTTINLSIVCVPAGIRTDISRI